jgi:hypothetical protein
MALLLALLLLLAAPQEPAPAQQAPAEARARAVEVPAQATPELAAGSKVWLGRNAEFEEFLRAATIVKIEDVPIGITRPRRAYFAPGGLVTRAVIKKLPPGRSQGYWESYKSEIAAYELDKVLDLGMVPVTVERRVQGERVSAQLWVEQCKLLKEAQGQSSPDTTAWNRQVYRQRTFDDLVGNIDRNAGNLLIDQSWNLILIDHSRAFTSTAGMPFEKQRNRIDRAFFDRMVALDHATLKERLGPWVLDDGWIRALLKRRDTIVAGFRSLAAEKGEAAVFVP